jgi:hypothetical protein
MRIAGLLLVVGLTAAAFAVRTILVVATRTRRPALAAAVDRWWAWAPAVGVAAVAIWINPWIGIPLAVAGCWALTRADAIGSPFRPRR